MSAGDPLAGDPLGEALGALDRALQARPRLDGQAFAEATRAACAYRDVLRRALRDGAGDRGRLKDANLAVTLLMAGRFPIGDVPWAQIEALRDRLAAIAQDAGSPAPRASGYSPVGGAVVEAD